MGHNDFDGLRGMKDICNFIGVSETTALKWKRELNLPISKMSKGKDAGTWTGSKSLINKWVQEVVE